MSSEGVVIQGLDLLDVVHFVAQRNKKFQAIFLNDLEEIFRKSKPVGPLPQEFFWIRKLYLDSQNNYTRSILRILFGDIEHLTDVSH